MKKELDAVFTSAIQKEKNARKAKLSAIATLIYLRGIAGISKAEDVCKSGNKGRGFTMPSYALPEKPETVLS